MKRGLKWTLIKNRNVNQAPDAELVNFARFYHHLDSRNSGVGFDVGGSIGNVGVRFLFVRNFFSGGRRRRGSVGRMSELALGSLTAASEEELADAF